MLEHTKKHPTEGIHFYGPLSDIEKLRKYARKLQVVETAIDAISAEEVHPEILSNPAGSYLKGIRSREAMTQQQLADTTGIPRRHISEMENGKRPIGKITARKLAAVLGAEYRLFL